MTGTESLRSFFGGLPAQCRQLPDFVLTHGREYTPAPLPKGIRPMVPQYCFVNCLMLAARRRLVYVEGYAVVTKVGFPVHHAWCVQPGSTEVIDPTSDKFKAYVGVAFREEYVRQHRRRRPKCASLLDNWQAHWPLLRATPAEIEAIIQR